MIVETKSEFTWENSIEQNKQKISGSLSAGHNFRLIIWNEDGSIHTDKRFYEKFI